MRILTKLILPILLTFCFGSTLGQGKEKLIKQIRKEFKSINSDSTLKKVVLTNEEFLNQITDGGGQLIGFYKSGQIKKIIRWVGLSNGNEIFEFYFKDNQLIFVYEQFNAFVFDEKKQTFRLDTTERTFEGRYYFADNKMLDHITTGHNRYGDDTFGLEKKLLTEADDTKKFLTRKIK